MFTKQSQESIKPSHKKRDRLYLPSTNCHITQLLLAVQQHSQSMILVLVKELNIGKTALQYKAANFVKQQFNSKVLTV